jgi:hypothetical protein
VLEKAATEEQLNRFLQAALDGAIPLEKKVTDPSFTVV